MLLTDLENENINDEALAFNASWDPEDNNWEDEGDEDFEDEDFEDRAEDLDDLHEIQVDDDLGEPDPDDDDHLPDDDD